MKGWLDTIASLLVVCIIGAAGGLVASRGYHGTKSDSVDGNYARHHAQAGQPVILLGSDACDDCLMTREYLRARGIAFADLDIEQSNLAGRWVRELGVSRVPVVLIGDRQIRGFRPAEIDAAIAAAEPPVRRTASR